MRQVEKICTALFDGTVVKLCFVVCGVAPGSVMVTIWVATIVFCQIGIWVRSWVYPGRSHTDLLKYIGMLKMLKT